MSPKIESGPEVGLSVGVDREHGKVILDVEVGFPEKPNLKPTKIRLHLTDAEVGELATTLVNAALVLRGERGPERQTVVIPKKGAAIRPNLKLLSK